MRVLTCFSLFMQMVEGTSYVIVPFMIYLFVDISLFAFGGVDNAKP